MELVKLFLCRLARDELTIGRIESLLMDVERARGKDIVFSCPHLATLAESWAERLNCDPTEQAITLLEKTANHYQHTLCSPVAAKELRRCAERLSRHYVR